MSSLIACPVTVRRLYLQIFLNINSLQGFSGKLYWRVVKKHKADSIKILRVEFKYFPPAPTPARTS